MGLRSLVQSVMQGYSQQLTTVSSLGWEGSISLCKTVESSC